VRVGAGSPLENEVGGLVREEVHDGQVDIKLLLLFVFHASREVEQAG
jgi:hypothetical protein